jgi:hypothetical protein
MNGIFRQVPHPIVDIPKFQNLVDRDETQYRPIRSYIVLKQLVGCTRCMNIACCPFCQIGRIDKLQHAVVTRMYSNRTMPKICSMFHQGRRYLNNFVDKTRKPTRLWLLPNAVSSLPWQQQVSEPGRQEDTC